MKAVGIIAEFNPFHNGHEYIIREARRITGAEYCIVVMSGDFVQRGEPAICDKYLRTRMALNAGADAVFEIPVPYATGSAEIFAEAGIKLLTGLGCVDYVAFGSECADIDAIMSCAETLVNEPDIYRETLKAELKKGSSFPAARQVALTATAMSSGSGLTPEAAAIIKSPNNILAVEYCKAIYRLWSAHGDTLHVPSPVTVKRIGNDYNDSSLSESEYSSATAVRASLLKELAGTGSRSTDNQTKSDLCSDIKSHIPDSSFGILREEFCKSLPIAVDDLSDMLSIRLATVSDEELDGISDVSHDLANAIRKYSSPVPAATFTDTCEALKSKNNTYSTVSRALLHIALGIESTHIDTLKSRNTLPYARLLGFKSGSSALLRSVSDSEDCILITKLGDARTQLACDCAALRLFEADIRATAVYSQLKFSKFGSLEKSEFERSIIRL